MLNLTATKAAPTVDTIITRDEARILGRLLANFRDVSGDDAYAKLAQRLCPTGLRAISTPAAVEALEYARVGAVPLKLGSTVRLKDVPTELHAEETGWTYTIPGTGEIGTVSLYSADVDGNVSIEVSTGEDYNRLHFNAETTDLSQWLEVL
jgi:hypothetical protein